MDERLLIPETLKNHSYEERLNLVKKIFFITDNDLKKIPKSENKLSNPAAIESAAKLIYKKLINEGYDTFYALENINPTSLATLLSDNEDFELSKKQISNGIHHFYKEDRDNLRGKNILEDSNVGINETKVSNVKINNLDINSTTALRIKVYHDIEDIDLTINSSESKKIWGEEIGFSGYDLMRGIKIPKVNLEFAILIGLINLTGSIPPSIKKEDKPDGIHSKVYNEEELNILENEKDSDKNGGYRVRLSYMTSTKKGIIGKQDVLYNETILPLIRKVFNLYTYKDPTTKGSIDINSKAIWSVFMKVLSMGRKIEERKLITANDIPKTAVDCEIKDLEMGLYIGQLAGKLRIITDKGYPVGNINMQNNEQLLLQLEKYSKQMGYPGNLRLNNTRIGYTKEVVGKMLESDFLKNQNFGYKNYKGIILK